MKKIALAAFAAMALGPIGAALPANTCIVSGSLERTPPASGTAVAMSGGLDSTWRMLAYFPIETFRTRRPAGLVMTIK